ncbi:MAG: riboflavin biosynthesis protein RibF [Rhodospirillaceae bacterium]|nr:riboflavin biosynthesis protein RibF [Rhodospirillaceae bacterium]|tara:strand:- start:1546 stop:2505 length:960 start_codon:yes stop_codon:yes gene_type:complete
MSDTRIIRDTAEINAGDWGTVAAVGNFDGVHLGHQKIIQEAERISKELLAPLSVLTFEPHPRMLFHNDDTPFRLTTSQAKASALSREGVQLIFELKFDQTFSQISAEDFVRHILRDTLRLKHVVCGYDFVFGHRRRGTARILENLAKMEGIGVSRMPAFSEEDGAVYSSTRVRQCLSEGDPRGATELLGRPWSFSSVVERGDQRGRTIGFPTCNLRIIDLVQPAHGVYAILAKIDDEKAWLPGVANFGRRPTVNDRGALFEVNLFNIERNLYGSMLTISVIDFIRPEMKFSGLVELQAQIKLDAKVAGELLANRKGPLL